MAVVSLQKKYKAVCQDCSKKYPWRDTKAEAEADADEHQAIRDHIVEIYTQVTQVNSVRH